VKARAAGLSGSYNGSMTITRLHGTSGEALGGFDPDHPCDVPWATTPLGVLEPRQRVAVAGTVVSVTPVRWAGGPVLEVEIDDGTGSLLLAFFGRHQISGVAVGRSVTAAGMVGRYDGRLVVLNPAIWITPSGTLGRGRVPVDQPVAHAGLGDQAGSGRVLGELLPELTGVDT
jgi:hypothetical protein